MTLSIDQPKIIKLERDRGQYTGKINLAINGFGQQKVTSVDNIVKMIDTLPDAHLQGLRQIVYAPDDYRKPAFFAINKKRKAEYKQRNRTIHIYDFDSPSMLQHMLYHEIGHHVFYTIIGSTLKKEWVTQLYPKSSFITRYAKRNASEDFAESYATFVLEPNKLKAISNKHRFLNEKVFKYFQPQKSSWEISV